MRQIGGADERRLIEGLSYERAVLFMRIGGIL